MDARLVDDAVRRFGPASRSSCRPTPSTGLCATPYRPEPVELLRGLKGRDEQQPIALLASDVDVLIECVPELPGLAVSAARALLPGPLTLVLPNPARRFPWLTGGRPDTIGVRVPELPEDAKAIVRRVGVVAATSANLTGESGPEEPRRTAGGDSRSRGGRPRRGRAPGIPSTVVDLTGPEPQIIREGAVPADELLEQVGRLFPDALT